MRFLYLCFVFAAVFTLPAAAQSLPVGARLVTTHVDGQATPSMVYQPAGALIFSSETGTQTASLPGPVLAVQPGRDGAFVGVMAAENGAADRAGITFQVYWHDGTRRYEHRVARVADAPLPVFALNDQTGAIAYGHPATGEVVVLDAEGQERFRHRLFDEVPYALERSLLLDFSTDGSTLAVAAMREPAHPDRSGKTSNADLLLFRADGTLLWRRPLPQQALHALTVSDNGRWIGVSTYDAYAPVGIAWQSQVFTPEGDTVLNVPTGFAMMEFAEEAPMALLIDKRRASAYDLRDGRIRYTITPDNAGSQMLGAALHPDGDDAIVLLGDVAWESSGFVYRQLRTRHLDAEGRTLATQAWDAAQHHAPRLEKRADTTLQMFLDASTETIDWRPKD